MDRLRSGLPKGAQMLKDGFKPDCISNSCVCRRNCCLLCSLRSLGPMDASAHQKWDKLKGRPPESMTREDSLRNVSVIHRRARAGLTKIEGMFSILPSKEIDPHRRFQKTDLGLRQNQKERRRTHARELAFGLQRNVLQSSATCEGAQP